VATQAQASPALKNAFMTRHLNIWVRADSALFDISYWNRCGNPKMRLEEFEGQPCFAAIDMAMRVDLAAASLVFPFCEDGENTIKYAVFHKCWLPESAVDPYQNPLYVEWVEKGFIEATTGEITDYAAIEQWLREVASRFDLRACGYDPYALMQFSQEMTNDGYPMLEFRMTTRNLSEPTKMLDALMRAGRLEQDANPVARLCVGNVVGHYDARGNVYPRKPRIEAKIDAAITTIMSLGLSIAAEAESQQIYAGDRELLVW